ncbi:SLBP-RNA-bind domain-containing protein [Aphelenchoides fujianensis]|nr:SLBP-RNA-bind domain-containing protein [Aphelenchoides fujianensis]
MASPRKQRRLNEELAAKTPQKETNDEEAPKSAESSAKRSIVFTPVAHFDWAEESARDFELSQSAAAGDAAEDAERKDETDGAEMPADGPKLAESGGPANRTRSRKKPTPQRADTKPKFEKVLDARAALNFARDERSKKLEAEKRRVEQGGGRSRRAAAVAPVVPPEEGQRKRRRSPSVSTVASNTPSRRQQTKAPRFDEDERKNRKIATPRSSARLLSSSSTTPSSAGDRDRFGHLNGDDVAPTARRLQPTEAGLVQRRGDHEIEITKSRDIYARYSREVPVSARLKQHPRTPNKYLNHSRRGWDTQMRIWKRSLYEWAGEYCPSSANTSRANSRATSVSEFDDGAENNNDEQRLVAVRTEEKITTTTTTLAFDNPDQMASMFGHFDMNTRQATLTGDESTLKAHENRAEKGATDFSTLF